MVFTTRCEASITLSTPEEFSEDIHLQSTCGRAEPFFSTTSKLVTDLLISIS